MHLDDRLDTPLYQQLFDQLRHRIEEGGQPEGSRLPPIRSMAADLGCARNTVENAYALLAQEGYVKSRPGSGYIVQNVAFLQVDADRSQAPGEKLLGADENRVRYDFTYGNLEPGTFPAAAWRAITDDILLSVERTGCDAYNDPFGEEALRSAIAWRLATQRGIDCTPSQIIIQGGTQTSMQNLLALFDGARDVVAMEDPGYDGVRTVVERARFALAPCRVGAGADVFRADLEASGARLAYLTPSSQFPTCSVMPTDTREAVLKWAERHDAYLLEDDYCRDFRYRERSLPPLASMDRRGRVIYMGTFSKSLSPALRINYLVLPEPLRDRWREAFASSYSPVPWLNQQVLARFMTDGSWDRHLRRVQAKNRRKYETLTRVLRATMGNDVEMLENGTGLHLLVRVRDGRPQDELVRRAAEADVAVYPTKKYWTDPARHVSSTVLVGFSSIAEDDIEPGIRALAAAWFG
ncbi:PLP-dependent aminotransferase family protein [Adlercreutzia caecimuris]|uniref:MocR-like pyridoxine biosynthesis transcription factor PdxR n=1 Tax=Adlercreutzia caecimuris TaxID=671266 RepID=UPI00214D1163|nr:PLP-dependent aminotransferase family protein [Adlercreutzia caecimuris]MCR2037742.1 PLP-dependent aminotransferase family protein [Adlercreutzia caecimuris]